MLCSLISDVYTLLLSHCSVSVSLLLYALWDLYTILSLLSILTMVLSVYTLYSMVLLFSLLFSVSIRYTLWFFYSHYYSQCLYAILFGSSVFTIISVSIRYTPCFTTSGIWLSKSCVASNAFLHLLNVVSVSGGLLVSYFLRPSMITLASSNPPWESNFPSSSTVAHECMGISAFKQ